MTGSHCTTTTYDLLQKDVDGWAILLHIGDSAWLLEVILHLPTLKQVTENQSLKNAVTEGKK